MRKTLLFILSLFFCCSLHAQTLADSLAMRIDTIKGKPVYVYKVRKSEGLYRIALNFGVTQESIIKLNPILKKKGLQLDQIIYVPIAKPIEKPAEKLVENPIEKPTEPIETVAEPIAKPATDSAIEPTPTPIVQDTIVITDSLLTDTTLTDSMLIAPQEKAIKIAYLLPFLTEEAKRTPTLDRFVEFYEGALLAIKEGQQREQKYEIFVYDTGKDIARIQQVLQDSALQTVQAIIGPAYPAQVPYVSEFAKTHQIPTIIPFTSKVANIADNPFILQFNPSEESMIDSLFNHLQTQFPNAHYLFVQTNATKKETSTAYLVKQLKKHNLPLQQVADSLIIRDSLSTFTQAGKTNIILFDTDKYSQIEPLLPYLTEAEDSLYLISYYGWSEHTLPIQSQYPSIFKTGKTFDFNVTKYNMLFHIYFGHDIETYYPRYDMLGYDITSWLIHTLLQETLDLQTIDYQGIQSNILFRPTTVGGGLENTRIQIIHHANSNIE